MLNPRRGRKRGFLSPQTINPKLNPSIYFIKNLHSSLSKPYPNSITMAESSHKKYRQYHPYQDLNVPIQNLYNLPTSPEFLFQEEASRQRRSWGENIQFYTGNGYLAGAILGGVKGTIEGLKAAERGDSMKLRLNRVLNSGGHMGMRFGNSLGVLGLIFAGLESGVVHYRGTDDVMNFVLAGLGTGAIYRAAKGPRSAAIASAVGGLAAGAVLAGKQVMKRYVPI